MLKEDLGEDAKTLKGVTLEKLRRSVSLRNLILEGDVLHFMLNETPRGSFEKENESYVDKM